MKSKRRLKMGEEAWEEYQKQRLNKKGYKWRDKNSFKVSKCRQKRKRDLIEYKGGKCQRCGYNKDCPSAFDFHHRNPKEKLFGLSCGGKTRSYEECIKEVDKCDLVCKNCHAEIHQEEHNKNLELRILRMKEKHCSVL